ncbi:MAG TPA: prepilin-type N-terminal cleavage/methylation domain-containing protein [Polyangia bacterium]|jgi:prepilin-type N-terminal cleavage/methylation domain-containing protein
MRSRRTKGFTLVELMIVVAIISVLAAVAIPAFQKYIIRSKAAEAAPMLRKIMDGAAAYFYVDHATSAGDIIKSQFPASTTTFYPAELPVGRKVPPAATDPTEADKPTWAALRFWLPDPVSFHYQFLSSGAGTLNQRVDVIAEGEIQPGRLCRYERAAWTKDGNSLELELSDVKIILPPE